MKITACDEVIEKGHLLVSKEDDFCEFKVKAGSKLFIFGGQPFEEPRYIDWNFVSHDKAKIEKAKLAWNNQQFPKVQNDDSYIPYPSINV